MAEGGPVGAELLLDHLLDLLAGEAVGGLQVTGRDHDRRLADDPIAAVDQLTELGEGLQAVAGVRLGQRLLCGLSCPLGRLGLLPFPRGLGGGPDPLQELVLV